MAPFTGCNLELYYIEAIYFQHGIRNLWIEKYFQHNALWIDLNCENRNRNRSRRIWYAYHSPFRFQITYKKYSEFRIIIIIIIRHTEWKSSNWKMKSQILRQLNAEQYAFGARIQFVCYRSSYKRLHCYGIKNRK